MVTSLEQQRQLETQEEVITRNVPLEYVTADSMSDQAQRMMGGEEEGTVAVNKSTNSLVLTGRRSVVERVVDQLGGLDEPTPQVTVQVRILSVRRSDFEGLGIHYELKDSQGSMLNRQVPGFLDDNGNQVYEPDEMVDAGTDVISLFGNSVSAVGNAAERIPNATFEVITTLLLGQHSLVTWIDAVQRLELAELQADPVVTVLDNRQARVHVGQRTPLRVVDQGSASAQGPVANIRTEETGVIIELTPRVIGANQVLIALHAERSDIQSFSTDAGYVFGTQQTDTEILLHDGETAVISGLTTRDMRNTVQGIPILMDLPLIGALFRTNFVTEEKEDLLIMVTPYIDRSRGF
jgi:type IV pilus assembly protein PilQ